MVSQEAHLGCCGLIDVQCERSGLKSGGGSFGGAPEFRYCCNIDGR